MHANAEEILSWTSLSSFYRQGQWHTVFIQTPLNFPGSYQTIVVQAGNFQALVEGKSLSQPQITLYVFLPLTNPSLTLLIYDSNGKEKRRFHDSLSQLKCLGDSEPLIGIFSSTEFFHAMQVASNPIHCQFISQIPDQKEGLDIFNLLLCETAKLSEKDFLPLQDWILSGGKVIFLLSEFSQSNFIYKKIFSLFDFSCFQNSKEKLMVLDLGMGKIGFWKIVHNDFITLVDQSKQTWPFLFQEINTNPISTRLLKTCVIPDIDDMFTPHFWNQGIKNRICLFSSLFGFSFILLAMFWIPRQPKITIPLLLLFLAFCVSLFFLWLVSYVPIEYQCWRLIAVKTNSEQATCINYHYFRAMRNQDWMHEFSEIPMPVFSSYEEMEQKPIQILRTKTGWVVHCQNFKQNQTSLWKTQQQYPLLGKIRSLDRKTFSNCSSLSLSRCMYVQQWGMSPLGEWEVGNSITISKKDVLGSDVSCHNLPDFTKASQGMDEEIQNTRISWLSRQYLDAFITGEISSPTVYPKKKLAFYHKTEMLWLILSP